MLKTGAVRFSARNTATKVGTDCWSIWAIVTYWISRSWRSWCRRSWKQVHWQAIDHRYWRTWKATNEWANTHVLGKSCKTLERLQENTKELGLLITRKSTKKMVNSRKHKDSKTEQDAWNTKHSKNTNTCKCTCINWADPGAQEIALHQAYYRYTNLGNKNATACQQYADIRQHHANAMPTTEQHAPHHLLS